MTKTVLITGGAGFIGCRLATSLLDGGHRVVVVDSLHPQVHRSPGLPADLPSEARFVPGDVTNAEMWRGLLQLERPDAIVHLAAETGTGQSLTEATRHGSVNVVGTTQMLDALAAAGMVPEQLLLASSRAVYGDGAWIDDAGAVHHPKGRTAAELEKGQWDHLDDAGRPMRPIPSTAGVTVPTPISVYAATKLTQEHLVECWGDAFGAAVTILRLQNVYGPGQAIENSYTGVLTFFARQAIAGATLDVYEDGEIIRDFVHVADVVTAMRTALEHPEGGSRTMDVGSGTPTTILQAAELIAAAAGAPEPAVSGRYRHGDVRAASCTIDAAEQRLGWRPQRQIADHVDELLEWVRSG